MLPAGVTEAAHARLVGLDWAGSSAQMGTSVAWHKDKGLSLAVSTILDLAEDMLALTAPRAR